MGHGQQFPEAQVQRWLAQLIAGLDFLHAMHVLHRDIKAMNIFTDARGAVNFVVHATREA